VRLEKARPARQRESGALFSLLLFFFGCSLDLQRVLQMRWMSLFFCAAIGMVACSLGGCGAGGPDAATIEANKKNLDLESKNKVNSTEELKKKLNQIAETGAGNMGSGMAGLRSSIEGLRASNAALADSLMADLSTLEQARDSADIKRIASQMAAKL
jgi:hypothetical protein